MMRTGRVGSLSARAHVPASAPVSTNNTPPTKTVTRFTKRLAGPGCGMILFLMESPARRIGTRASADNDHCTGCRTICCATLPVRRLHCGLCGDALYAGKPLLYAGGLFPGRWGGISYQRRTEFDESHRYPPAYYRRR